MVATMAIDSLVNRVRGQLRRFRLADRGQVVTAIQAASTMYADGTIPAGVTDAQNIFDAQVAAKANLWSNLQRTATVVKANGTVTSTMQFTAQVPTAFMGLFGKTTMAISGTSKASNSLPLY